MAGNYYDIESEGGAKILVLRIPNWIDISDFDTINRGLLQLTNDADTRWVIDLSKVNYLGSAMLGMLLNFRQGVKSAGGAVAVCGLSAQLVQIFATSSLHRLLPIAQTRAEGVRIVTTGS